MWACSLKHENDAGFDAWLVVRVKVRVHVSVCVRFPPVNQVGEGVTMSRYLNIQEKKFAIGLNLHRKVDGVLYAIQVQPERLQLVIAMRPDDICVTHLLDATSHTLTGNMHVCKKGVEYCNE